MVTVWIFFGSGVGAAGAGVGAGDDGLTAIAGGGPNGEAAAGAPTTGPGAGEFWPGTTGMVETMRGLGGFAGSWMSTGCSSCDTSFSVDPPAGAGWPALAERVSPLAGTILFGQSLALMMGGSVGSTEPPNIVR